MHVSIYIMNITWVRIYLATFFSNFIDSFFLLRCVLEKFLMTFWRFIVSHHSFIPFAGVSFYPVFLVKTITMLLADISEIWGKVDKVKIQKKNAFTCSYFGLWTWWTFPGWRLVLTYNSYKEYSTFILQYEDNFSSK